MYTNTLIKPKEKEYCHVTYPANYKYLLCFKYWVFRKYYKWAVQKDKSINICRMLWLMHTFNEMDLWSYFY